MMRGLSFHQDYRCRRSGACCTAGWPIPIEADRLGRARAAIASGALRPSHAGGRAAFIRQDSWAKANAQGGAGADDAPAFLATAHDSCVFYDENRSCRIHDVLGHDALPLACRQFPRVTVRDPRGVSVVLSAYCPTAAAMLDDDAPIAIIEAPEAFPIHGEYVGLDAREAWAPMLRPNVLMDWDAWWTLERGAIDLVGTSASLADAVAKLRLAIEHIRTWTPGEASLVTRVREGLVRAQSAPTPHDDLSVAVIDARRREVESAIPDELRPAAIGADATPTPTPSQAGARAFLACHVFGNWSIHLGQGLRTWLRSIETTAALLASGLSVREADLRLRHLADPKALVSQWAVAERE